LFVSVSADVSAAIAGLSTLGVSLTAAEAGFRAAAPAAELLVAAGAGLGLALGAAASDAADFQTRLTEVRNNTTMTDEGMQAMQATVLRLGAEAPVSLDNLATGFMHVSNFGFGAADATMILEAAMRSATSTGGNTSATAEVLAAVMHEFGIAGSEAASTMDQLHIASAEGNMTLEQFSSSFGQVAAFAAAVGIPLDQAAAAMSAMTRHGFDAATAAVQVKDEIQHLINPSKAAEKVIADLSARSGVDLVNAFTATGVHTLGLTGVLDMTRNAMDRVGLTADQQTSTWLRLVPNIRGGAASFILAGRGAEDFRSILGDMQNSLGVTDDAFARIQATVGFQWGVLGNQIKELGIAVGNVLLPPLSSALGVVSGFVDSIRGLPEPVLRALVGLSAVGSALGVMVGGFVLIAPFIVAVGPAFAALAGVVAALAPVLLVVGAAVAVFAAAWQSNLGGIQDIVGSAFEALPGVLDEVGSRFQAAADFWESTIVPTVSRLGSSLGEMLGPALSVVADFVVSEVMPAFSRLSAFVSSELVPALGTIGGFLLGEVVPRFQMFASTAIPTVIEAAAKLKAFWDTQLGPAFREVGAIITSDVMPAMQSLAANALPALESAAGTLSGLWTTQLAPAFERVGGFVSGTVGPWLQDLAGRAMPLLQSASAEVARIWTSELQPAFQKVIDAIGPNVGSAFSTLGKLMDALVTGNGQVVLTYFREHLPKSLVDFGTQVASLGPLFGSIGGFFGAIINVMNALGDLKSTALQGLFENVLIPGFQRLGLVIEPTQPALQAVSGTFGALATSMSLIGDRVQPITGFFLNATDALNGFAKAIRDLQLPPWLTPGSGANPFSGNQPAGGPQFTPTAFSPNQGGGSGGSGFGGGTASLITIGTLIVSNEAERAAFLAEMAAAVDRSARRVNQPADNSGFPQLAISSI